MTDSFFKNLKNTKLTNKERVDGLQNLRMFMKDHPVRPDVAGRLVYHKSRFSLQELWKNKSMKTKLAVSLIGIMVASSGVSYAAEASVPGDLLYPVKINVNENVRAAASLSAESKAEWATKQVERRLEEAETLAAQGKLDSSARETIEAHIESHTENIEKNTHNEDSDAAIQAKAEIHSQLESSLQTHEGILNKIASESTSTKDQITPFLAAIKTKAEAAQTVRVKAEEHFSEKNGPNVEIAAKSKLSVAENAVAKSKNALAAGQNSIDAGVETAAESKIKAAENTISEGKIKLQAQVFGDAFILFQKAQRFADEARLIINAGARLQIKLITGTTSPFGIKLETEEDSKASTTNIIHEEQSENSGKNDENKDKNTDDDIKVETNGSGGIKIGL